MHPQTTVDRARRLSQLGLIDREVAQITGVPIRTIQKWRTGTRRGPCKPRRTDCPRCTGRPLDEPAYSYVLGLYLGDGWLTRGRKDVFALNLACCDDWPGLFGGREERDVIGDADVQGIQRPQSWHDRGQEHFEALAVPFPVARAWPQTHPDPRRRRLAAGHCRKAPGGFRQRALPLRRLSGHQSGAQELGRRRSLVRIPAVPVHE